MKKIMLLGCLMLLSGVGLAQKLSFRATTVDVGTISEDDAPSTYVFRFSNQSLEPVVILRVVTSCGCAQPEFSRKPIAPNEEGELRVKFFPRGRAGALHKSLYVYTNASGKHPAHQLMLTGMVSPTTDRYFEFPHQIGALRLKQRIVNFRKVDTRRKQISIEVANASDQELEIQVMGLPRYVTFRSDPQTIAPDGRADLVFVIDPTKIERSGAFECEILLDGDLKSLSPLKRTMLLRGEKL